MSCPPLEELWLGLEEKSPTAEAHLRACPSCAARLEDHRQLEKDLFRLVDSPPPPDFVSQVMAKVDASPQPAARELWVGSAVLALALLLVALVLPVGELSVEGIGAKASALVLAFAQAIEATATGASLTVFAAMLAVLTLAAFALKALIRERASTT